MTTVPSQLSASSSSYRQNHTQVSRLSEIPACSSDEVHSFEAWCDSRTQQSPQFQSWYLVLSMELDILSLIRLFREANFDLYRQSLVGLIQYVFANNNVNYARWLPIHLRDMSTPPACPCIPEMSICCTQIIDQAYDKCEDPSALRRWMIPGPEVSQLVAQYEIASEAKETVVHTNHHEQTPKAQQFFPERVVPDFHRYGQSFQRREQGPTLVGHKRHCPSQCS